MSPDGRTPLFELERPLTSGDLKTYELELALLQGNILKGHGRREARHVFVTFRNDHRDDARRFLAAFAHRLTSAAAQMKQSVIRGIDGGDLFVNLGLTAKGYAFLDPSASDAQSAAGPVVRHFSKAFQDGMESVNDRFQFKDALVGDWHENFRSAIHVLIVLAHDNPELLEIEEQQLRRQLGSFADTFVERGQKLFHNGSNIEHFGYVDAVSQPIFFEHDLPETAASWDPSAGPRLALVRDPLASSDVECGSYLVFRKLEQDVKAFRDARLDYAGALGLTGPDAEEKAGALIIGRFEDGTARAVSAHPGLSLDNDFDYRLDPYGLLGCPLDAHIRIVNPRTPEKRKHRIVRRGMSYGDPAPENQDPGPAERGLLFQCYQRDLTGQFEYLQTAPFSTMDRMLRPNSRAQKGGMSRPVDFKNLVTLKGGGYFFVPAISALRRWVAS